MSSLSNLKAASNLSQLATLLSFKPSALSYILYVKPKEEKYEQFEIPKKSGGVRTILKPCAELKALQKNLSVLLTAALEDARSEVGQSDEFVQGFSKERSIHTNADRHTRRRFVLNVDLNDFFGSINFGRVRGFFIKNKLFKLDPPIATIIAQIACHENLLPQGSPCSPVISNLIARGLDAKLVRLAQNEGCIYTRYVDDITFSTNKCAFPERIASNDAAQPHLWKVSESLRKIFAESGFSENSAKTRMQYWSARQEVTGLVVNRRANVPQQYRKQVRAMVNQLVKTGSFFNHANASKAGGLEAKQTKGSQEQLNGMLSHIYYTDLRYQLRLAQGLPAEERRKLTPISRSAYRRFLLFKELFCAKLPIIICEGKTDLIYLRCALRRLCSDFPVLISSVPPVQLKVRLFRTSDTRFGEVLGINGGSGDLKNLVVEYVAAAKRFPKAHVQSPIIILIDNDAGAKGIFSWLIAKNYAKEPSGQPFIHVSKNMYIVPTPKAPDGTETQMESFFPDSVKNEELGGKRFSMDENADKSKHYGKAIFAEGVVKAKEESIDFCGFKPLLENIESAISHYLVANHFYQPTKTKAEL